MEDNYQELRFKVGEVWKGSYVDTVPYSRSNVVQDPVGLSVYRSRKDGNVGHPLTDSVWWTLIIDMSSIKDEEERMQAIELAFSQSESLRVDAEQYRQQAEQNRQQQEQGRVQAESVRVQSENARIQSENARNQSEQQREANEQQREGAEQQRNNNEASRNQAELQRSQSETLRANAEDDRESNEQSRQELEQQRIAAEQYRETTFATFEGQIDAKLNKITEEEFNQIFE